MSDSLKLTDFALSDRWFSPAHRSARVGSGSKQANDNSIHYQNLVQIVADIVDSRHADDVELRQTLCKVAEW